MRTSFDGAILEGVVLKGCRAAQASFQGARFLDGTIDGGDFSNTNMRGATLTAACVKRCKMTGVDFTETQSLGAEFEDVLLVLAKIPRFSFRKMTLKGTGASTS